MNKKNCHIWVHSYSLSVKPKLIELNLLYSHLFLTMLYMFIKYIKKPKVQKGMLCHDTISYV